MKNRLRNDSKKKNEKKYECRGLKKNKVKEPIKGFFFFVKKKGFSLENTFFQGVKHCLLLEIFELLLKALH